jgi:hypothetical protein
MNSAKKHPFPWDTQSHRFTPRLGQSVAVCCDGKWSRAVLGVIVRVERKKFVVRFVPWASTGKDGDEPQEVEMTVIRRKASGRGGRRGIGSYGGWVVGSGEVGILRGLGCRGDYYSVIPRERLETDAIYGASFRLRFAEMEKAAREPF